MNPEVKIFEVRDRATFMVLSAVFIPSWDNMNTPDSVKYLIWWAGHARDRIMLYNLTDPFIMEMTPNAWKDRTYKTAHKYIEDNWKELVSGQVLDVEFILGEVDTPKESQRLKDTIMIKEIEGDARKI